MDNYDPAREITDEFLARVTRWIQATGEVLVVLRYLHSGNKDFIFCRTPSEFLSLVNHVSIGTDTIVFEQPQLPLRGVSSESFIEEALAFIPDGTEYLIARTHRREPLHLHTSGSMGDTHASLREDLRDFLGEEIAVGPCPNFWDADSDTMISASKGGIDGPR